MKLTEIHQLSFNNKGLLQKVDNCGCFHCLKQFKRDEIKFFLDNNQTALCPYCEIDSIIPESSDYELSLQLLEQLNKEYFTILK